MTDIAGTCGRTAVVLDGTIDDVTLLGGKGAALDRLVAWGLPVPAAGSVTTTVYRGFVARLDLDGLVADGTETGRPDDAIDRAFLAGEFDPVSAGIITDVAREVAGGELLAVRSSATLEDLAGSSFAGQYRSILEVDPEDDDALLDAVRLVFASLWHRAPRAYRRALGVGDQDVAMAVVLMRMVEARRAGVVFTVDPAGTDGSARVEAVAGPGAALVSGERTPRAWLLDRVRPDDAAPAEVLEALDLAVEAERRSGSPQDVEWVWDGARTWIVQARPITTTGPDIDGDGFDDRVSSDDLTTMGIGEMLPGVLPPLLWEINSHLVEEAFRQVLDGLGIASADTPGGQHLLRRVRGRAALDFGRLKAMAEAIPGADVDHLEAQYFGSRRRGRPAAPQARREGRRHHLIHDVRVMATGRRKAFDAEVVVEAVHELVQHLPDLSEVSDRGLLRHRHALVDLGVRAMGAELGVAAAAVATYRRVELMLLPHIGEDEAGRRTEAVTAGLALDAPSRHASAALFGGPTWTDLDTDPPRQRPAHAQPPPEEAMEALVDVLDNTDTWSSEGIRGALRLRALRHAVTDARGQLERRERTKAALLRLGGEVRRTHDELALRLCDRSILDAPEDVELLTTAELAAALGDDAPPPSVIARRKRWRTSYEHERPLPARFTGAPRPDTTDWTGVDRLEGWAASRGRFTGRGQVIHGPKEHIEPGAVLIAEATDASWSPLFVHAGAIVLERGGPLSHAAILARELGVPAVLNVPGVTHALDGRELTIDGDSGLVLVHDEATEGDGS